MEPSYCEGQNIQITISRKVNNSLPCPSVAGSQILSTNRSTRDNKFRDFSFRFLHKILTTKTELFKFRIVNDELCIFCANSDSIEHTFLDCITTSSFYSEALIWFNGVNICNIALSNAQIAFNDIPLFKQLTDRQIHRLHLFIILLKQYIYSCKCLEKKPIQHELQDKAIFNFNFNFIYFLTKEKYKMVASRK